MLDFLTEKDKILRMKKNIIVLFLMFFLSACASEQVRANNNILTFAKPQKMAQLHGKKSGEIETLLGTPSFVRTEMPNQTWTYKTPNCALFVFFGKDGTSNYAESKGECIKTGGLF